MTIDRIAIVTLTLALMVASLMIGRLYGVIETQQEQFKYEFCLELYRKAKCQEIRP